MYIIKYYYMCVRLCADLYIRRYTLVSQQYLAIRPPTNSQRNRTPYLFPLTIIIFFLSLKILLVCKASIPSRILLQEEIKL